jgi:hypothetical protein
MSKTKAEYEDNVRALEASIVAEDEEIVAIKAAHAAEISTKDVEMAVMQAKHKDREAALKAAILEKGYDADTNVENTSIFYSERSKI